MDFKLSFTISGHSSDVRDVSVTTGGDILTASRDCTAKHWKKETREFSLSNEYIGHSGYVTSIVFIPPNRIFSEGLVVTGSRDSTILLYKPGHVNPLKKLTGHSDTVSCLAAMDEVLVSGSWDHRALVWSLSEDDSSTTSTVLDAHSGPIWAVALFNKYLTLSASADKTILLWRYDNGSVTVIKRFLGHTDCVRGLAVIDSNSFISCSNDATIRRWNVLSATCNDVFYGHTNFIYSVAALPDGGFASSSEDRTMRVWDSFGTCRQVLHLPCQSAWAVVALPNGDIAVGSSDGACRVFTKDTSRIASASELHELEKQVAVAARPAAAELDGVSRSDLPDKTALLQPGKKDGHTIMVREEEKVMCYSWSAVKQTWVAVGEVVGSSGGSNASSGKVLYQGREYDYVFNVELDEGESMKLPYNNSEDPWHAAQSFIHKHQLPQDQLDKVAQFIITNSNSAPASQSEYFDPFTGDCRYVSEDGSSSGPSTSAVGNHPYNSSNSSPSSGPSTTPSVTCRHFPQANPLLFEACNKQGIVGKLQEHNLIEHIRLSDVEMQQLLRAVFDKDDIEPGDLAPLEKALQWSVERVWPALDVLRLCLRSQSVQEHWVKGSKGEAIVSLLVSLLKPPASANTQLLAVRCLSNLAAHATGSGRLLSVSDSLISTVTELSPYSNKNLEIAAATLMLNFSVLLTKQTDDLSELCQLLSGLGTLLISCKEPEAQFRTLVALGTALSKGSAECRQFAVSLDMCSLLEALLKQTPCDKVKQCAQSIMQLLKL